MTTCVSCEFFNLKHKPEMARLGFGMCRNEGERVWESSSESVFVSSKKEICEKFLAAPALTTSTRIEWIDRQGMLKSTTPA